MDKKVVLIVALVLGFLAVKNGIIKLELPSFTSLISVAVDIDVKEPDATLKALVGPVSTALANAPKKDRLAIAHFYTHYAKLVISETNITTNARFRAAHILAGKTMFTELGLKDKYPGLDTAIDKAFTETLSLNNKSFEKEKAVAVANAIAWAALQ